MDDGILSLKWNNHNSTFIHTLSSLHKVEMYSDVTLACEGKYFPVHKLVLSVCSEYFEEILSKTKCQHPVIVLKDIKHSDLEALLNYMYAGEANVTQSELANLIKAAECLRIKGLAVPDEGVPVRDKRRHSELAESSHNNKKRRNDDSNSVQNEIGLYKNTDSSCKVSQINLVEENKRPNDDGDQTCQDLLENNKEKSISTSYKNIPEIDLEGEPVEVKQEVTEPKIEEQDDSHQNLTESNIGINYATMGGEESNDSNRHGQDSHLTDLMTHSIPGPSGVQGHEGISSWENNSNNLTGYSVDSYSSDESRNQQLDNLRLDLHPYIKKKKNIISSLASSSPGIRLWHCPYEPCGYIVDRESALRKHIRKHTGEKPFACSFCSFSSAQNSNLRSHMKLKHQGERTLEECLRENLLLYQRETSLKSGPLLH